ncbi:Sulfate permease 2 [Wallemia ichthyophaga EXF-994]|uniref:Sulfate permease 2 n=1 Tax=Wallemia ichthyophaga (strain EXF-994 / CBS 113033) TaxID=1299270 RepID=R9AXB3_WALI9|nr:Sulfate permease 2 [Wallemia ichthyophaga EXF-994]EOR04736.1 Sulfate permease 2 [Wallemia ichthyophaga EXF-994]
MNAKIDKFLQKLGIERPEGEHDRVTRGESIASNFADPFVEPDPTVGEWFQEKLPNRHEFGQYCLDLLPFLRWVHRYNLQWLIGDLIAGITVGAVVVPQGMAYAELAGLEPQFGLYSSFVGVIVYWFFATSKDITIGPVAVMSTLVGEILQELSPKFPDIPDYKIAGSLAVITGAIVFFMGLIRVGWIVDFIPLPAIAAFMTGSSITIIAGQVPSLLGNKDAGFDTNGATYMTIIKTLKHLPESNINAAMGVTSLFLLYLLRETCTYCAKRWPNKKKIWFFANTLRTVFVILLYTLISWLVNRHRRGVDGQSEPLFDLIGTVPRGFKNMNVPTMNADVIRNYVGHLPGAVIVLLIEHIAISKSFGRVNNYTINPSQELIAIGVTNLIGPFFGAYPATGSFSRTAIKSKAGVRTPFAGVITGVLILLAIYALTAVFFYISKAVLAAVIIHAVGDLILPIGQLYAFWKVSPLDALIFVGGVIIIIFTSIEIGIYVTVCVSAAVLLFRIAKAHGEFLGRIKVQTINGKDQRNIWLPENHQDGSNPLLSVQSPYPGVFVYRFTESFIYANANHYTDEVVDYIKRATRKTHVDVFAKAGDRPWNDPGPRKFNPDTIAEDTRPTLKAIIFDMSSVTHVDVTSTQVLVDVKNQLDRWASPDTVQWHFAGIRDRWIKRALAAIKMHETTSVKAKPLFSVAEVGQFSSENDATVNNEGQGPIPTQKEDIETGINVERQQQQDEQEQQEAENAGRNSYSYHRYLPVLGVDRAFHPDVDSAVRAVIDTLEQDRIEQEEHKSSSDLAS